MKRLKTVGAAGALVGSALVGGTLISAALAAPQTTTSPTTTITAADLGVDSSYRDTYLDALAAELGVDRSALGPAAVAAAEAAIDAAEAAGDIDADRAEALRSRLSEIDDPERLLGAGIGLGFGPRGPGSPGRHGGHWFGFGPGSDVVDGTASALGMDVDALIQALRDGSSLEEVAADQGVAYETVKTAVTTSVTDALATAVDNERITQAQADEILSNLQSWLDDGGQPGEGAFGPGFRHGPRVVPDSTDDSSTDVSSS